MFKYADLAEGCSDLRKFAEMGQKGEIPAKP